jgi:hypothetical protein
MTEETGFAAAPQRPPTRVYDAFNWRNLPRGRYLCVYGDGAPESVPTVADIGHLAPTDHRVITVTGNYRIASIIDGRPDNNLSDAVTRGFVRGRKAQGMSAIIYAPRAFVAENQRALSDSGAARLLEYERLWWWIPTLDGRQWTPAELSQDLAAHWGALVEPDRIWANQNDQLPHLGPGATVDVSTLFLAFRP